MERSAKDRQIMLGDKTTQRDWKENMPTHMYACVNTSGDKHHIIVHIACWPTDSIMLHGIKLFKPGCLTPSSMASGAVPSSDWEMPHENQVFALTPLGTGTSVPASPMWTEAQMPPIAAAGASSAAAGSAAAS